MDAPPDPTVALRRELDRLRAENARLTRLLGLRAGQTDPAPAQAAIPLPAPGMVTMASSTDDKIALFADRFRTRRDVYAVRSENTRTGQSWWLPAVAGGWRKGTDRRFARYLPLTPQVIAAHLAGEAFIGLYPLARDNSCHFLAADFDGPAAMLDALAYVKAAAALRISVGLEISQSGRGAHAWMLFDDAVPAVTARTIGSALIREAILLRGSMDLRSYDRLFPNQDVMPDGGLGNLIAAPLQGRRRKDGLTLFLDTATLEPHADQWAYLSTLDRLTPHAAERIARHVGASSGALVEDEARNQQVVDDVVGAVGSGRNCLVLVRRVAHVERLGSLLAQRGLSPLVMQGGMPVRQRRAVLGRLDDLRPGDGGLVIGTTPFVGEGFDVPALDTLFLATPVAFDGLLVQCAGRVVRAHPGKEVALVVTTAPKGTMSTCVPPN